MFLNLIVLQIEGIFYDCCLDFNISEERLKKAAIGEKLDNLISLDKFLFNFEYFKFKFPVFRNKVAHGKLFSSEESSNLSSLILLDLHYVCEYITTADTPINILVKILKEIDTSNQKKMSNFVKAAYVISEKIEVPDFYNLQNSLNIVKNTCQQQEFFDYLLGLVYNPPHPIVIKGIEKLIKKLQGEFIPKEMSIKLLKEIQQFKIQDIKNLTNVDIMDFFRFLP